MNRAEGESDVNLGGPMLLRVFSVLAVPAPRSQTRNYLAPKARFHSSLGQRPRDFVRRQTVSAESAIHSDTDPRGLMAKPVR